jgi:hypothetical protein
MKHALSTACAVFALSFAGAALADSQISATLETPQAAHLKLIAASAVWNCQGDTCFAAVAPDDAVGVSGCKELARQVGRLSAYTFDAKSLDEKGLAKCNTAAKASVPAAMATASGR